MRRIVFLPFAFLMITPAAAQQAANDAGAPIVTVRGDGTVQVKPNYARLVASVVTDAASLKDAADRQRQAAAKALALVKSLAPQGVKLDRSDFTLNETMTYPQEGAPPVPQYTAETDFVIRVDALDKLDADVAALVDSGLMEVTSAKFEIVDQERAVDLARGAAIKAAAASARAYAEAGGFQLGSLNKVLDVTPQTFSAFAAGPRALRAQTESVALIPPSRLTFHASVVATWRIQSP